MVLNLFRIALAIILFYFVNWVGAKSKPLNFGYVQMSVGIQDDTAPLFNYLFKVLAPIIYIILLAVLFQNLGLDILCENLYLIVAYYWIFRFLVITFRGQLLLLNWKVQILYWVSSIALAIWVNSIIDKVESVLPSPQTLLEQLWILIILFLYSIFNKMNLSREGTDKRIKKYTFNKVVSFKKRFGIIIDNKFSSDFYKAMTYSIMIYEDFNRPAIARFIERIIFHFSKNPHTYGIMQVKSLHPLSDEESVIQACDKIKADVISFVQNKKFNNKNSIFLFDIYSEVFSLYNPNDAEYCNQVIQVYENIVILFYPSMPQIMPCSMLLKF